MWRPPFPFPFLLAAPARSLATLAPTRRGAWEGGAGSNECEKRRLLPGIVNAAVREPAPVPSSSGCGGAGVEVVSAHARVCTYVRTVYAQCGAARRAQRGPSQLPAALGDRVAGVAKPLGARAIGPGEARTRRPESHCSQGGGGGQKTRTRVPDRVRHGHANRRMRVAAYGTGFVLGVRLWSGAVCERRRWTRKGREGDRPLLVVVRPSRNQCRTPGTAAAPPADLIREIWSKIALRAAVRGIQLHDGVLLGGWTKVAGGARDSMH